MWQCRLHNECHSRHRYVKTCIFGRSTLVCRECYDLASNQIFITIPYVPSTWTADYNWQHWAVQNTKHVLIEFPGQSDTGSRFNQGNFHVPNFGLKSGQLLLLTGSYITRDLVRNLNNGEHDISTNGWVITSHSFCVDVIKYPSSDINAGLANLG